jgi:hypothetical protein
MSSEKPNSVNTWVYYLACLLIGFILAIGLFFFNLYIDAERNQAKEELLAEQRAVKPDMPIRVSIREALMGSGLVAQFANNSNRYIAVVATFTNPTTNQYVTTRIDISPNKTKEIGHLEGWAFSSGDEILLEHNDYRSSRITVQ